MSAIIINPYVYAAGVDEAYSFTYDIDAGDPDVILYGQNLGTVVFNYDIDWGDGTSDSGVVVNDQTHTYLVGPGGSGPVGGIYTVRITGVFPGLMMGRGTVARQAQINSFLNWGINPIKGLYTMFNDCINMTYDAIDAPNLSELDAVPISTQLADGMFNNCPSVTSLDLSDWTDTDKITSLADTFKLCSNLTLLNLTGWDTSNVSLANYCASGVGTAGGGCEIIMPNFDFTGATNVNNIYQFFQGTKFSTSPNLTNWTLRTTAPRPKFEYIFFNCDGQVELDLSTWNNTNKITTFLASFHTAEFTSYNLTGWDTSNITTFNSAFYVNKYLTHITGLSEFNSSSTTDLRSMFYNTPYLTFGLSGSTTNFGVNWGPNLTSVGNIGSMFRLTGGSDAAALPPDISNWATNTFINTFQMFQQSSWNGELDFSNWNLSGLTYSLSLKYLFYFAGDMTTLEFDNANFPSTLTDMSYMLHGAHSIESISFGTGCDFSNITTLQNAFYGSGLTNISFANDADFSSLITGSGMMPAAVTMGTANYDNFLTRMDATWVDPGGFSGTLTMGASKYTGGGTVATARAALVTAGWTITDGGIA